MHIYDTLIIGSGYFSLGFALAKGNCLICEENQICDTHFYLPLKSFEYKEYIPQTEDGKRLFEIFSSLSLFENNIQNTNGFECGFCKFITETDAEILLKCRVIKTEKENELYKTTVQTNEGLSYVYSRNILNTLNTRAEGKFFTVLFSTDSPDEAAKVFENPYIEPAFYKDRYAMHIKADGFDENSIKLYVYEKWKASGIKAKILYMAPCFSYNSAGNNLCDDNYQNPIEAFEAGYKEGKK